MTSPRDIIAQRQRQRRELMVRQQQQARQRQQQPRHNVGRRTRPTQGEARQIEAVQFHQRELQRLTPFTDNEGRVDLLAALDAGVPKATLDRFFKSDSIQRATTIRTAKKELGDLSPVEFIREGGNPDTLRTLGVKENVVTALKEVRPFITEKGLIDTRAAQLKNVAPEVFKALGVEPRPLSILDRPPDTIQARHINSLRAEVGHAQRNVLRGVSKGQDLDNAMRLAQQRAAETWREFGFDVAGMRSSYEVEERQLRRIIGRREELMSQARAGKLRRTNGSLVTGVHAEQFIQRTQQELVDLRARQARNRQGMDDFDAYVRAIRPRIQETINQSLAATPRIVAGTGGVPGTPSPEASRPVPVTFDGLPAGADIPGATAALKRAGIEVAPTRAQQTAPAALSIDAFPKGTRFQLRDKDGKSKGFAAGQKAVDAAIKQGFDVVPVTLHKATESTQRRAAPRTGPSIPEEDREAPKKLTRAQERQRREARERAEEQTFYQQQNNVRNLEAAGVKVNPDGSFEIPDNPSAKQIKAIQKATGLSKAAIIAPGVEGQRAREIALAKVAPGSSPIVASGVRILSLVPGGGRVAAAIGVRQTFEEQERRRELVKKEGLPKELESRLGKLQKEHEQNIKAIAQLPGGVRTTKAHSEAIAVERQIEILSAIEGAVRQGGISRETAVKLVKEVPNNPTAEDMVKGRRLLGGQMQILAAAPGAGIAYGPAGTALTWKEDSKKQRALNIGLDVIGLVPTVTTVAGAAKVAGAARGVTRAGIIAKEAAIAELNPAGMIPNPKALIKGVITDPIEAFIRPSRAVGLEETTNTLRVRAETGAPKVSTLAPEPAETVKAIRSGDIKGTEIKDAVSEAALKVMQTGKTSTARVSDSGTAVTIRAGAAQKTLGGAAFHATPDGRNIIAGAMKIEGKEGGLFVAPTPMTRFAEATAFGKEVPLSDAAKAAIKAGKVSDEPIPTVLLIRDPEILKTLNGATDASGAPKIYEHMAEVEGLIPNGTVLPQASQVRFMRDASGRKIALAVIGKPLSKSEMARLKVKGLAAAVKNIATPGVLVRFDGAAEAKTALEGAYLDDTAEALIRESKALREAGKLDEALALEREAGRIAQRAGALNSASVRSLRGATSGRFTNNSNSDGTSRRASDGDGLDNNRRRLQTAMAESNRLPTGIAEEKRIDALERAINEGELTARKRAEVEAEIRDLHQGRLIHKDRVRLLNLETRINPRVAAARKEVDRLERQLDRLKDSRAPRAAELRAELRAARAELAREATRTRAELRRQDSPGSPRPPRTPRVPDSPRPPRTPRTGRTPDGPRPPRTPKVPDGPRPPRVPRDGDTMNGGGEGEDKGRKEKQLRVVGLNRGAAGDTAVNLVTGRVKTKDEISGVPQSTKKEAAKLEYGGKKPVFQRIPWGANDRIIAPDGTVKTVKAGTPIKAAFQKRGRKL